VLRVDHGKIAISGYFWDVFTIFYQQGEFKMRLLLSAAFVALFYGCPLFAAAFTESTTSAIPNFDTRRNENCHLYDRNPTSCNAIGSCSYDHRTQRCDAGVDCFSMDYYTCSQSYSCHWDRYANTCLKGRSGGGYPPVSLCSNIYEPFQCNQTPGCVFDNYQRACVPGNNGGGYPGYPNVVHCNQISNRYQCERKPGCYFDEYNQFCQNEY
jgi:hypothetical protein